MADLEIGGGGGGKPNENMATIFLVRSTRVNLSIPKVTQIFQGSFFPAGGLVLIPGGVLTPCSPLRFRACEQLKLLGNQIQSFVGKKMSYSCLCIIEFN